MSVITDIISEITSSANFLAAYDNDYQAFLNGTQNTCLHILDVIDAGISGIQLSNDASAAICFSNVGNNQGQSMGALSDYVYSIDAIQRISGILPMNKAAYYVNASAVAEADSAFYLGEAARTVGYLRGTNPDQGIKI